MAITTNPYAHAATSMLHMTGKSPSGLNMVPGLPATKLVGSAIGLASKALGATKTVLGSAPQVVDVTGQPSMKVIRAANGVTTRIQRNSQYADYFGSDDIRDFNIVLQKILQDAERLSHGGLSYAALAARNHPYGRGLISPSGKRRKGLGKLRGARGGVSNMAVVNEHTGAFARAWTGSVNVNKSGAIFELSNDAVPAPYLAFGTSRMKAHGPFTAAVVKNLPELNRVFLQAARRGHLRQRMEEARANG